MPDLPHQDFLLTVAEIGAAFVGFSLLVSALRSSRTSARFSMMRDVAEISLYVIAAAVAPYVLASFGLAADLVWRLASMMLALAWIVGSMLSVGRLRRMRKAPWLLSPSLNIVLSILNLSGQLMLWRNVILGGLFAPPTYLLSVLFLLGVAAILFVFSAFLLADEESDAA